MKKALFTVAIVALFLGLPLFAFSQTEVVYPEMPGFGVTPQTALDEGLSEEEVLPLFMGYIFQLLLVVSLLTVFAVLVYAGALYMLSSGRPDRNKIAREWILSAMQGALVVFVSYTLLFAIDSRFVLFELRDPEEPREIDPAELEWEIKNRYYQIPFGMLIEDAILNEIAESKFYDVYDATVRAEAVAESIYQESVRLMQTVEFHAARCPSGRGCGSVENPEEPEDDDPWDDEEELEDDPEEDEVDEEAEEDPYGEDWHAMEFLEEDMLETLENDNPELTTFLEDFNWVVNPETGEVGIEPKDFERDIPVENLTPENMQKIQVFVEPTIVDAVDGLDSIENFGFFTRDNDEGSFLEKEDSYVFFPEDKEDVVRLDRKSEEERYRLTFFDTRSIDGVSSFWRAPFLQNKGKVTNFVIENVGEYFSFLFEGREIFARGRVGEDETGTWDSGLNYDEVDNWMEGDDHWRRGVYPEPGEEDGHDVHDPRGEEGHGWGEHGWGHPEEDDEGAAMGDEEGEHTPADDHTVTYDDEGNVVRVEDEDGNVLYDEQEEGEPIEICITCPDIRTPILAQVSAVRAQMRRLPPRLRALEDTKEPLLQDLYELYKVAMLKSLGSRHVFGYNSFLLERRYYEREEVIIETHDERTEIGEYVWDWRQWIENLIYEVEVDGETIEENDPATFYLRRPDYDEVIDDAMRLARDAWDEGIQDAGEDIGIERELPDPPPDIGTTFYPPVSPNPIRVTSPFGERYDPFTGEWTMHYGIDFAGPRNTPIYASEAGEVVFADWAGSQNTGYGKLIVIYHREEDVEDLNQDVVTYYAHLNQGSFRVEEGDSVERGEHIAGMGTTGRSTGYHLHYEARVDVDYPFEMHTGRQVDPAPYIDLSQWEEAKTGGRLATFLENALERLCMGDVSAMTDMEMIEEYMEEHGISRDEMTGEMLEEIAEELGIEIGDPDEPLDTREVEVRTPSDYLVCGMEIPVGETFELTWEHLVEILDTIDDYIAEGERLLEQQERMNRLAATCSCPCSGAPTEDCPATCSLNCPVGAIRSAHQDVARTRAAMRSLAEHLFLLTDGHFNTPTEDVCDPLNEDIRSEEEEATCEAGGEVLITKHELITRKLNYARFEFDECITRPEELEDVLEGGRTGKTPLFGPLVEEEDLPRYTKTREGEAMINTSEFNWFCCSDSRLEDN